MKKAVAILCALMLMLFISISCAEEDLSSMLLLPSDQRTMPADGEKTEEQIVLPTPPVTPTSQPVEPLPSLSRYVDTYEKIEENYLSTKDYQADAHFYFTTVTDGVKQYLDSCVEKGYLWEYGDFFANQSGYRIRGGQYTAYLVPNFGNSILVLTEKGMPYEQDMPPEQFQEASLLLTVNGSTYRMSQTDPYLFLTYHTEGNSVNLYGMPQGSSFFPSDVVTGIETKAGLAGQDMSFSSSSSIQRVSFGIPIEAATSGTYTANKRSNPNNLSFVMKCSGLYPDVNLINYSTGNENCTEGLEGDDDFFTVKMVYVDKYENKIYVNPFVTDTTEKITECKCIFEGRFRNGSVIVSGSFCFLNP